MTLDVDASAREFDVLVRRAARDGLLNTYALLPAYRGLKLHYHAELLPQG